MQKSTEITLYKRGKEILNVSFALAFTVISSGVLGFEISQIEKNLAAQKISTKIALSNYENKKIFKEMTNNYNDFKEKLKEEIIESETIKKVVTPSSATTINEDVQNSEKSVIPEKYKEVIEVKATSYCLCKKCCGKSESNPEYGVTRSGLKIVPGTGMKVIAVDPSVIPLGSKVYVEGLNGVPDYGYAIAADTGGAIKNKKIDLYFDSHEDTVKWGIKNMRVYVIE